jgi:hypothetical protein
MQHQFVLADPPRLFQQRLQQRTPDALAAVLSQHRHAPDVSVGQQASGADNLPDAVARQDMPTEGIEFVPLHGQRNTLLLDEYLFTNRACQVGRFTPVSRRNAELHDINRRADRHPVEQFDNIPVSHAYAANRAWRAHRHSLRRTVQINEAPHGIDRAQAIAPDFLARQPQNARQYPVALRKLCRQLGGPDFPGRTSLDEHGVIRCARADLGPDDVAATRRHEAAEGFAHPLGRRRDRVAAQQAAMLVMQFQRLLRHADTDAHRHVHATSVLPRRAAKKLDNSCPHSSAITPPSTSA